MPPLSSEHRPLVGARPGGGERRPEWNLQDLWPALRRRSVVTRAHLRLATLEDLYRIYTDADFGVFDSRPDVHQGIPPPGFTLVRYPLEQPNDPTIPLPYIWGEVRGDVNDLAVGDLYWITFAQYASGLSSGTAANLLARLSLVLATLPGGWADPLTYPIVYEVGKGATMRWLKSTYRGELGGGVEQFQFSINLGNPGNDPDIDEAAALALAEQLATMWSNTLQTNLFSTGNMGSLFSTEVKWTEVGVTTQTQTDPTSVDGTGGNLEQSYPTQWFAYPVGSRPSGTAGATCLPYEVACAVTLQTDTRGPRGRGRIYLPPFAADKMAAGGLFTADSVQDAGNGVAVFFDLVIGGTPYVPLIVSRRAIQLHAITSINTGRVPDAQRRRRRSQDEARISATVQTSSAPWQPA